jgi:hypothetical protein
VRRFLENWGLLIAAIACGALLIFLASMTGCAWFDAIEKKIPPIEACFYTKHGKVCAVKVVDPDGKSHWMIRTDLGPEERAQAEAEINRREGP